MVECLVLTQEVGGSRPSSPANFMEIGTITLETLQAAFAATLVTGPSITYHQRHCICEFCEFTREAEVLLYRQEQQDRTSIGERDPHLTV